jgi:hypothetical protein
VGCITRAALSPAVRRVAATLVLVLVALAAAPSPSDAVRRRPRIERVQRGKLLLASSRIRRAALIKATRPKPNAFQRNVAPATIKRSTPIEETAPAPTLGEKLWAFGEGTAQDGWRHTLASIRRNPVLVAAGVVSIGVVGAVAKRFGLNGELPAIVLSAGALVAQIKGALRQLEGQEGLDAWRTAGAEIAWPTIFSLATYGIGHQLAGGGAGAPTTNVGDLANAAAASAAIGIDVPAVGVQAYDGLRGRTEP